MLEFIHYLNYSGAEPSILATEKPQINFDSLDSIFQACKKASRQLDDLLTI
jgi:ferritin